MDEMRSLTENDVRVIVGVIFDDYMKDAERTMDKKMDEYLEKKIFDIYCARTEPYISGIRWLFVTILTVFGLGAIAVVFGFIKK